MSYTATDEPSVVVVSVEGATGKLFLINTAQKFKFWSFGCLDYSQIKCFGSDTTMVLTEVGM